MNEITPILAVAWSARRLEDLRTRRREFRINFPQRNGGFSSIRVPADWTASMKRVLEQLRSFEADLPPDERGAIAFLRDVIADANSTPDMLVRYPTFVDGGFVAGKIAVGQAKSGFVVVTDEDERPEHVIGHQAGLLKGWADTVGRAALHSTFVTVAIEQSLCSFLRGYYRARTGQDLISEGFVINYAGESSSGKTTLARIFASSFGHPDRLGKWDFTRRGLEERLAEVSYLGYACDDIEKHTGQPLSRPQAVAALTQYVADGRSMNRSRMASKQNQVPDLSWVVNAISSSPEALSGMLAKKDIKRTAGEEVRLIEISVPQRLDGGIIDCVPEGKDPVAFATEVVRQIEIGLTGDSNLRLSGNWGHLLPAFITALFTADYAPRIKELVDKFVDRQARNGTGWDRRFAAKWGLQYAAGRIAVELGLLDWPKGWPWKATTRAYKRALKMTSVGKNAPADALRRLALALKLKVNTKLAKRNPDGKHLPVPDDIIALRIHQNGRKQYGIFEDKLRALIPDREVRREVLRRLERDGHYERPSESLTTCQISLPISRKGKRVKRPRVVLIRREFVDAYAPGGTSK